MPNKLLKYYIFGVKTSHFWRKNVDVYFFRFNILLKWMSLCAITKSVNHRWFIGFIARVLLLPDATSCDKVKQSIAFPQQDAFSHQDWCLTRNDNNNYKQICS